MIIPSKEVVLITAAEAKQLFMLDAKTGCVLQKFSTESSLASSAAYYLSAQQLILPHLNNTYVNIWDADTQEPKKFSVGEGEKISSIAIYENSFMLMGSSNGNLYIFQIPSGINVRRVSLHSSSIVKLLLLDSGYLISCTQNEVKLWGISQFLCEKKTPIPQKTIHSTAPIIDIAQTRQILLVCTENTFKLYHTSNLQQFDKQFPGMNNFTHISCTCSTRSGFFVGNSHGKIKYLNLDGNWKEMSFNQNKKILEIKKCNNEMEIDAKDPLTSLAYLESLSLLISGNCKGEIKIWEDTKLKNSMHLFKTGICHLFCFPKPNKATKIPHCAKIKALHKQELTKLQQPVIIYSETCPPISNKTEQQCLFSMLDFLNDPTQVLTTEIQQLKQQNKLLIQANLHYQNEFQKECQ